MSTPDDDVLTSTLDEGLKAITIAAVGSFPIIGGLASAFLSKVYDNQAEQEKQKGLKDMEKRIKEYSAGLVDAKTLQDVQKLVSGYEKRLDDYVNTEGSEKGDKLTGFCGDLLSGTTEVYGTNTNPEKYYTIFMAFATLHLTMLRDQAYYWNAAHTNPDKSISSPHVNADKHTKELFDQYEAYITVLGDIRVALETWRLGKISESCAESDRWYQNEATGGDTFTEFRWSDSLNNANWFASTSDAGYTEENAAETRRNRGNQLLGTYRANIVDENQEKFNHEGQEFESYSWRLARDFEPAKLWRYVLYPQGTPAEYDDAPVLWTGTELKFDEQTRPILQWKLTAPGAASSSSAFPLYKYLASDQEGLLDWDKTGKSGSWPHRIDGLRIEGTKLAGAGYDFDLSDRLVVVADGDLRFLPQALSTLTEWNWGIET